MKNENFFVPFNYPWGKTVAQKTVCMAIETLAESASVPQLLNLVAKKTKNKTGAIKWIQGCIDANLILKDSDGIFKILEVSK